MHYKVLGHLISTEGTAKPRKQASAFLRNWISSYGSVQSALDYGCGRLRYVFELSGMAKTVTLVDSEEQLSKEQVIGDAQTTIREFVRENFSNARVLSVEEFALDRRRYDFALCANVLPVIPSAKVRSKVMKRLATRLRERGKCLFVAQYRNSYFKAMAAFDGSTPYLDGWAVIRKNCSSTYYGLLPPPKLARLVKINGFRIERSWIEGQSTYALCLSSEEKSLIESSAASDTIVSNGLPITS